ncbi:hypothetical protein BDW02DRAFT_583985 [Decorospora gaudefroyi]|uniref:F-box domain-containing protein n=1 Tax=Decorospora gaudefroyi TaxID=184978 RepID=A0A6A5JWP1_9PLEO|nr:hypothetical protein BDW02DRAFT_583985 [Decorospora gaudefroyi]
MPTDVFRILLGQIQREDVNAVSQVSRACRVQCEPLLFRTVTLNDGTKHGVRTPARVMDRLQKPGDALAKHVRDLVVAPSQEPSRSFSQTIVRILKNLQHLASFSWNAEYHIPAVVLDSLHHAHPSAQLKVTNHNRQCLPLDQTLLSSPQLQTLDMTVGCIHYGRPQDAAGICELPHLKELLVEGGNLKALRLHLIKVQHGSAAARTRFAGYGASDVGPLNFRFEEGDAFPALEEMVLRQKESLRLEYGSESGFGLGAAHCEDWKRCMDWSNMRKLDLGRTDCVHLLHRLTGALHQLTTLRFEAFPNDRVLQVFLSSVPRLVDLTMVSSQAFFFDRATNTICNTAGAQLKTLVLEIDCPGSKSWLPDRFRNVLESCYRLESFKSVIDKQVAVGDWTSDEEGLSASEKYERMRVTGTQIPSMLFLVSYLLEKEM